MHFIYSPFPQTGSGPCGSGIVGSVLPSCDTRVLIDVFHFGYFGLLLRSILIGASSVLVSRVTYQVSYKTRAARRRDKMRLGKNEQQRSTTNGRCAFRCLFIHLFTSLFFFAFLIIFFLLFLPSISIFLTDPIQRTQPRNITNKPVLSLPPSSTGTHRPFTRLITIEPVQMSRDQAGARRAQDTGRSGGSPGGERRGNDHDSRRNEPRPSGRTGG